MNDSSFARRSGWVILGVCLCLLGACTTRPGIDWNSRMGVYTYDEAVAEYGPPDKSAQLSDKSTVAEWLTRKGDYRMHSYGYGYYGGPYRPYYPGYMMAPYIDKNPSHKPEDRKFAISLFTVQLMFWAVLVMIGSFFRGPGQNFVFPWNEGIFFDL